MTFLGTIMVTFLGTIMVTTWAAAMRLMFSISQSDLSKSLEIFNFFQRDFSAIMAYI